MIYLITFMPPRDNTESSSLYRVIRFWSRRQFYRAKGQLQRLGPLGVLKHLDLLLIHAPETQVEKDRRGEENASQDSVQDNEMGVLCERSESHGEKGADSGHGDGEGVHDGAHTLRCLIIRMFRPGGKAKHLCHSSDRVDRHLQEHGDVVRDASVVRSRTFERRIVAGSTVVDQLL